jgi:hypothetical protein
MKNGFVKSVFSVYFPDVLPRPPIDEIPPALIPPPPAAPLSLDESIKQTLDKLSTRRAHQASAETAMAPSEVSHSQTQSRSSIVPSSPVDPLDSASGHYDDSDVEMSGIADATMDDVSEVTDRPPVVRGDEGEGEPPRYMELEPWVWTNSLVKESEAVIRQAVPQPEEAAGSASELGLESVGRAWRVWSRKGEDGQAERWLATVGPRPSEITVVCRTAKAGGASQSVGVVVDLGEEVVCAALEFFDELELALVLQQTGGEGTVYLATIDYPALAGEMSIIDTPTGAPDGGIIGSADLVSSRTVQDAAADPLLSPSVSAMAIPNMLD